MIGIERKITDSTRLIDLTVGELRELFKNFAAPKVENVNPKRYAYGINGLADTLNVSKSYANKIKKSGKLDAAIKQEGRKIIIDADLAIELFGKK